jgi:hypothetical protein
MKTSRQMFMTMARLGALLTAAGVISQASASTPEKAVKIIELRSMNQESISERLEPVHTHVKLYLRKGDVVEVVEEEYGTACTVEQEFYFGERSKWVEVSFHVYRRTDTHNCLLRVTKASGRHFEVNLSKF